MGTRLLIALALVASLAACKRTSELYCKHNPTVAGCAPDAAIVTCGADTDCPIDRPHCDVPSGTCVVQCTSDMDCSAPLPFCDIPRQICVECTKNEQCASGACLIDGTCQSVNNTAYVDGQSGDDANPCSEAMPCLTLERGLMTMQPNVKLSGTFVDAKKVMIAQNVNIFADPPGVTFMVTMNGDAFTIAPTFHVSLTGIDLTPTAGNTIKMPMPATLTLSQCAIHGGTNGVLAMAGGSVTISQTIVYGNMKQGVVLMGATHFDITNSIFVHNGAVANDVAGGGIGLGSGTGNTDRFEFNTVADNFSKNTAADSGGVGCPVGFSAPDNLLANNTGGMLAATANSIGCVVTGSRAVTDDSDFVSPSTNDYHLVPASPAIDGAPADPAITTDYDGEARPNGGYDFGADEHH